MSTSTAPKSGIRRVRIGDRVAHLKGGVGTIVGHYMVEDAKRAGVFKRDPLGGVEVRWDATGAITVEWREDLSRLENVDA